MVVRYSSKVPEAERDTLLLQNVEDIARDVERFVTQETSWKDLRNDDCIEEIVLDSTIYPPEIYDEFSHSELLAAMGENCRYIRLFTQLSDSIIYPSSDIQSSDMMNDPDYAKAAGIYSMHPYRTIRLASFIQEKKQIRIYYKTLYHGCDFSNWKYEEIPHVMFHAYHYHLAPKAFASMPETKKHMGEIVREASADFFSFWYNETVGDSSSSTRLYFNWVRFFFTINPHTKALWYFLNNSVQRRVTENKMHFAEVIALSSSKMKDAYQRLVPAPFQINDMVAHKKRIRKQIERARKLGKI